uniref:Pancreatic lipase-like protein n=1 Tax=Epiphyas postvittana TaxID=65032 RepID=F5GTG1_EPIPO
MLRASFVCFVVVFCFVAACLCDPVPDMTPKSERNAAARNTYYITSYAGGANANNVPVENSIDGVAALGYLDGTQTVTIVVHGRDSSAFSDFAFEIRNAIVATELNSAVIVVDWSAIAGSGYNQARALVPQVAQDLSNFIVLLEAGQRLNRNLLHIIGFDLGAHVAGITSRITASRARKITALSPAGVGWDIRSQRLLSSDAQLVEVIHTDAVGGGAFGMVVTERVGSLDFFPNGGTRQPGCSNNDNACHHNRAWQLFVATVQMGGHLTGTRCDTLVQALNNRCTAFGTAVMGTNVQTKLAQGMYALTTGRAFPYTA